VSVNEKVNQIRIDQKLTK